MPQIRIINARGEVLQLYPSEDYIVEVQGVTPVAADVSYSDVAGGDGGLFNAARVGVRSIELLIALRGADIERKRLQLYQFFRAKTTVTFAYRTDLRDVQAECIVETPPEGDLFSKRQVFSVSLLAMNPYFHSAEKLHADLLAIISMFEFPFFRDEPAAMSEELITNEAVLANYGEDTTTPICTMDFDGRVLNPIVYFDGQFFAVDIELQEGDRIVVDARRGKKTVTLRRDGADQNVLNRVRAGSRWFSLPVGETVYQFSADAGPELMHVRFDWYELFAGV